MQYLLYYIICCKVQNTTREVFVANVMDATLTNHRVFMQWHAH
jgi:hypothetical protein